MTIELLDVITEETPREILEALDGYDGEVEVLINSPGGSVYGGLSAYSILSQRRDRVSVRVLGIAASIASLIALAGRELIMADGSFLMIHDPWTLTIGNSEDHAQTAGILEKIGGSIRDLYVRNSRLTADEVAEMMKAETWFTAQEAVEAGLADTVDAGKVAAMIHGFDLFNTAPSGRENTPLGGEQMKEDVTDVQDVAEEEVEAQPTGRKIAPKTSDFNPGVLHLGMHRDGEPLNFGAYIRGAISNNWKHADKERQFFNSITTGGDGAGLIPDRVSSEIWFELLGRMALTEAGAPVITLPYGSVSVPYEATAPSAAWVAEGATISDSGGDFDAQALTPHKIAFLVTVSNEMLQDAPAVADQHIRTSILRALSRGLNAGYLNGTGADNQPTGLLVGSPSYANDQADATATFDMLASAYYDIVGAGGVPGNVRAIMDPATAKYLDGLREDSTAGGYLSSTAPPAVKNMQKVITDVVGVASGTPDTSQILLADWQNAVRIYSFGPMRLDVDRSAAFASDSVLIRCVQRVDLQVAQSDLIVRLDNVGVE